MSLSLSLGKETHPLGASSLEANGKADGRQARLGDNRLTLYVWTPRL